MKASNESLGSGATFKCAVERHSAATQGVKPPVDEHRRFELRDGRMFENGAPVVGQPFFSVIMPTYNRKFCISRSIDSALAQTYGNFELIIVDDGSTDGTEEFVRGKYANELASGRIRFLRKENSGVCRTRNAGLRMAKGEWFAYLDSDNEIVPDFIETVKSAIAANPEADAFYAKLEFMSSHRIIGGPFDYDRLRYHNFIDLGTYVHRRSLYETEGGFDESMTRLVDWELIVRYSARHTPVFIDKVVLHYEDSKETNRITNLGCSSYYVNLNHLRRKHCADYPLVTTVVTTYNHEKFIAQALESAVAQEGRFIHEILVSDDCSTDGTRAIVGEIVAKNPGLVFDISGGANLGISENMRKCIGAARGKYIAWLEGDDYWASSAKLRDQVDFMESHTDCPMVFCALKLLSAKGLVSCSHKYESLSERVTGYDFFKPPAYMGVIGNYSTCMFRADRIKSLPESLYKHRLSEIALSFYLERFGALGFVRGEYTVYRQHPGGVWSGAGRLGRFLQQIRSREQVRDICREEYVPLVNADLRKIEDEFQQNFSKIVSTSRALEKRVVEAERRNAELSKKLEASNARKPEASPASSACNRQQAEKSGRLEVQPVVKMQKAALRSDAASAVRLRPTSAWVKLAVLRALRFLGLVGESRYRLLRDYLIVEKSRLFDAEWYLRQHPELEKNHIDPIWHYCKTGWREGFCPSPLLEDVAAELKKCTRNPVVERAGDASRTKVSVVVASYNYANYIRETIESLLRQTYENLEIVVVDDGSSDDSVKVIREYMRQDCRIKLYMHPNGKNRGLPATVKLGVEKAKGEYVAFCESDDMLEPTNIEEKMRLVRRFNGEPNIIINDVIPFGDEKRIPKAQKVIDECMQFLSAERNEVPPLKFREANLVPASSCCMVRRVALLSCDFDGSPQPSKLDWWLWRQICCTSPLYVVHSKLTRWRLHDSFITKESIESVARQWEFMDKMDALLVERHPEDASDLKPLVDELKRFEVRDGRMFDNGAPAVGQPFFSIIMPTYNRKFCISKAIDSVLAQTYGNFELIIVDDGSTDGTEEFLRGKYANELASGRIRYKWKENSGVCKTRNVGLQLAKGEWIAYIDSDNEILPFYLEVFARAILANPESSNFYAKLVCVNSRLIGGKPFDLAALLDKNFIDLGVYVHRRALIDELGPFDENMTRLVDWELIVRQSKKYTPTYINTIVMLYNDDNGHARITNSASLKENFDYVKLKHCGYPIVTTMITAFNHRPYLKRAIESALMQKGRFVHEVLVADDCSTDGTEELLAELQEQYPGELKVLPSTKNLGIAENMRRCFAAAKGKYIAVLEGDDYWITPWKLNRQVRFLTENPDCSMVFSRIKMLDEATGKFSLLSRQNGLKSKLTGDDFIKDPTQNLIANFSCCMFVAYLVKNLPEEIYAWRLNEISMSFYLEQKGPIGFQPDIMSVYRRHDGSTWGKSDSGTWSKADERSRLLSGIRCREVALQLCAPKYRDGMMAAIEKRRAALEALGDE